MSSEINSRSLNFSITTSLITGSVFLVLITAVATYFYSYNQTYSRSEVFLSQMFLTVKKNASVAAYVNNRVLAQEVVDGLAESDLIAGSIMNIDKSKEVVVSSGFNFKEEDGRIFPLKAPFSDENVGHIAVYISHDYISSISKRSLIGYLYWQVPLLFLLSLGSIVIVSRLVTRPITSVAKQLHHVVIGGDSEVICPKNHLNDEIGLLTNDINHMLSVGREAFRKEEDSRKKIEKLEFRFRMIFENSKAGIILIDAKNHILMANPSFRELFYLSEEGLMEDNFSLEVLFDHSDCFVEHMLSVRGKSESVFFDLKVNDTVSKDTWVRCILSKVEGNNNGIVEGVFYDISDRAKLELTYSYQATHDALTGLLNRLGAEQELPEILSEARKDDALVAFFLCDLNDFKPINDLHGHESGDKVLVEVARRLMAILRTKDVIVRWGGDEFVLGIMADNIDSVKIVAEKILSIFDEPVEVIDGQLCDIGSSIGISLYPEHDKGIDGLIDKADTAMYVVKNSNKNGYNIYSSE